MDRDQASRIIETLLYMTDHPLSDNEIVEVLDLKSIKPETVRDIIRDIAQKYDAAGSPLHVVEVAGGSQMATRPEMAPWIRRLFKERLTVRLSPSALETLSIIAYKQPIARSEIEQIRGVEATGVMETLLERRLIKVVGRKETIGRPLLYGTTIEFLRQFNLRHLSDLPDIQSITPAPESEGQPAEAIPTPANEPATNLEQEEVLVGAREEETAAEIPEETPHA